MMPEWPILAFVRILSSSRALVIANLGPGGRFTTIYKPKAHEERSKPPETAPMPPTAMPPGASSSRDDLNDAKPYIIGIDIGKGSFATVYKGYHEVRMVVLQIRAWIDQET